MNAREIAGAIPIIGTFVALGTLIKEGIARLSTSTDKKIADLIEKDQDIELRNLLLKKTPEQDIKNNISDAVGLQRLNYYYNGKFTREAVNVSNAAFELIPVIGLIHHLIFRKTLHEVSQDDRIQIAAQSMMRACAQYNRVSDVDNIQRSLNNYNISTSEDSKKKLSDLLERTLNAKAS